MRVQKEDKQIGASTALGDRAWHARAAQEVDHFDWRKVVVAIESLVVGIVVVVPSGTASVLDPMAAGIDHRRQLLPNPSSIDWVGLVAATRA